MAVLLLGGLPAGVSAQDSSKPDKAAGRKLVPVEVRAERAGVSEPVRDLPATLREIDPYLDPREIRNPAIRRVRKAPLRREAGVSGSPDQALSPASVPNVMDPPLVSFEALNNFQSGQLVGGFVYPPDTNGDIGPNHYVQAVNLAVRVFNRTGTPLTPAFLMSSLFTSLGGTCATSDDGDPIVLYDHLADRWLISQFALPAFPNPPFHQCVAVSQTGDPAGAYYVWDFVMPNANLNDYPHFGVWPDAYYMTDNQFLAPALGFNGAGVFAFDRAKMLAGNPAASFIYFDLSTVDPNLGGMLPSDLDGPPRVRPNVFAMFTATEFGDPQGDALRLFEFTPNFAMPASSTFVELPTLPVAAFDPISPAGRADIPQPGTAIALDSIGDRIMHRLQYRNFGTYESLVTTHTVDASGDPSAAVYRAGVRYYELRRTLPSGAWSVREQATFAPADGIHRWMGSAAMDNDGNLAVGYSVSAAATTFPGIRYAGRLAADPLGGLAQGEATLIAGSGVQTGTANRWGDYSNLSVDPTDDCTFWYTQEYYSSVNPGCTGGGAAICWQTRVGSFRFPSCTPGPANGTITGTVTNSVTTLPVPGVLVTATGGFSDVTDAGGVYSMSVPPGTYDVTASLAGYQSSTALGLVVTSGGTTTANLTLTPTATLVFESRAIDDTAGNGNGNVDRDECIRLGVTLRNTGAASGTGISGTLATSTPNVTITTNASTWPDIGPGTTGATVTPFVFQTDPAFVPGTTIAFTLSLTTDQGPVTIPFTVPSGTLGPALNFNATGPVPIPDNNPAGASLNVAVSGLTGAIGKVRVATRITHTWDGDLALTLAGPDGTTVQLSNNRGGSGDNFGTDCPTNDGDDTIFDDAAATAIAAGAAPFVGSFRPEQPLAAFNGKTGAAANGTWVFKAVDNANLDVGNIECVTITINELVTASAGGGCLALSIGDATVTEGDAGSLNASFTVTLTPAGTGTVTVNYATADGTATAGSDYTATSGPLTFTAGQTTQTVLVPVLGDTMDEDDETFTVNLSGASGASVADGQGIGTITDNDAPPTLGVSDRSQPEGTGGTIPFAVSVTLSAASGKTVTVNAATADGTAVAPGDYATRSALVTFAPGTTTSPFVVDVVGDPVNEPDETFLVNLSGATNATIADSQGVATLLNDDTSYYTITPCRVADTRSTAPPALVAGASRNFTIAGACGIPADAQAVAFNLTVTEPSVLGNLRLHPAGTTLPVVSAINFAAGQTRGNNAIIPLGTGGQISVFAGMGSGTVHLILDVTGYFK